MGPARVALLLVLLLAVGRCGDAAPFQGALTLAQAGVKDRAKAAIIGAAARKNFKSLLAVPRNYSFLVGQQQLEHAHPPGYVRLQ